MSSEELPKQVKKAINIVTERNQQLFELEINIKLHKEEIDAVKRELSELEKLKQKTDEEYKEIKEQLEQIELMNNSVTEIHNIGFKSIVNHNKLIEKLNEENNMKQKEVLNQKQNFQIVYDGIVDHFKTIPLNKEYESAKAEFLKIDIALRQLKLNIDIEKTSIVKIRDIQKKRFYNFFVTLTENYLRNKKMCELEHLKREELSAIKQLKRLEEEHKMRTKFSFCQANLEIQFGSPPEKLVKQSQNSKVENQSKKDIQHKESEMQMSQAKIAKLEKISTLFDDRRIIPKVQVLGQTIINPIVKEYTEKSEELKRKTLKTIHQLEKSHSTEIISNISTTQENTYQRSSSMKETISTLPDKSLKEPIITEEKRENISNIQHSVLQAENLNQNDGLKAVRFNFDFAHHESVNSQDTTIYVQPFANRFDLFTENIVQDMQMFTEEEVHLLNGSSDGQINNLDEANFTIQDVNESGDINQIAKPLDMNPFGFGSNDRGGGFLNFGSNNLFPF
ncbi:hypothetical protein ABEB36_004449 [Hypothenemus hampei]|uniref:Uncharacterized protein n=1 Tax=Hypothenemus hampei TaxID=57062 RepID=A0ABD1F3D9_HYPHA